MISGISRIESELSLRLVTGEFEILAWLYRNGPTRSNELSRATKVSIANFQGILRRLKGDGIIVSVCDPNDRRVRLFDLAESVRQACETCLAGDVDAMEPQVGRARLGRVGGAADHLAHEGPLQLTAKG